MPFDYRPLIPFKECGPKVEKPGFARHAKRTLPTFSLEGRVAVITGGARGLGLVMGQGLVISGAELAIVDLDLPEAQKAAKSIAEEFAKANPNDPVPKITAHHCDVADEESVNKCFAEVVAAHGKIDSLITSAGFTDNINATDYPYQRFRKLYDVDVGGTWLWSIALAKHLIARQAPGSIVMIGSMSGAIVNVPQPQSPYNSAKAAVRQLCASFAVEWARYGIRVNCLSPGYMLTPLTKVILESNPDIHRQWTFGVPMSRMGNPEDLMGACTYLLSDAALYTTGADLRVDGGFTVC